jgi:iron complex outermembrane receptor protein
MKTLDQVTVTGSRIKRAEIEESLPITSFSKEQIDAAGISSAEQLLMQLNIAGNGSDNLASNGGIVSEEQRGNNGVSGANLRGQGADATLVLLNGRRVATHGLKGRAVDLNSIPFAAIERVEVLRDGASAIYGTDAIGGVINFITKRDFKGAQVSAFVDYTEAGGGNIIRQHAVRHRRPGQGRLERVRHVSSSATPSCAAATATSPTPSSPTAGCRRTPAARPTPPCSAWAPPAWVPPAC